jgi:hypothetical protein
LLTLPDICKFREYYAVNAYEAVVAKLELRAEIARDADIANDAVPCSEPVMLGAYNDASSPAEPDVKTFFQLGILFPFYIVVRYIHLCRVYAYFLAANNIIL